MATSRRDAVRLASAFALFVAALPGPARAAPHLRDGWYGGIGYGGGRASAELVGVRQSRWSGTVGLRAGCALGQDLLLGAEFMRWADDNDVTTPQGSVPARLTLAGAVVAVTYFPGGAGFMLRGGLGLAVADTDIASPAPADPPAAESSLDTGIAAMVSAGYEVRLSARFALGAAVDLLYLGVSGAAIDRAYIYGVNIQFNWYR